MQPRIYILFIMTIYVCIFARRLSRQVTFERVEQHYSNPDYVLVEVILTKVNRKMFSINTTVEVVRDAPASLRLKAAIHKYADNTYKATAFAYEGTLCEYFVVIQKTLFDLPGDLFEHYITTCPIKKGVYYAYNLTEKLAQSPFLPLWKCKLTFHVKDGNILVYNMTVYFRVEEL